LCLGVYNFVVTSRHVLTNCTLLLSASYPKRSDHGLHNLKCRYCGVLFWHGERVGGIRGSRNIVYNNCCKSGKVCVPTYRTRPESLASLARFANNASSRNFMKNIRQYNCLFTFTSMGLILIDQSMMTEVHLCLKFMDRFIMV
jgi:hypothetical protein